MAGSRRRRKHLRRPQWGRMPSGSLSRIPSIAAGDILDEKALEGMLVMIAAAAKGRSV